MPYLIGVVVHWGGGALYREIMILHGPRETPAFLISHGEDATS